MKLENLAAGVVVDGKYRLETILGRGSYGDVWKARVVGGQGLPECVAIKFFTNQDRALKIYLDEADRIRALEHPRIVKVYESGRIDGLALIVMEYIPGGTLLDRLGEADDPKPVSLEEALKWAHEIAELLAYLHDLQPAVMHSDLKLDNLLVDLNGNVHLIDFGQSRRAEKLFVETAGVGAFPYMAPELLGREGDRSGRRCLQSDIYAFGVILYRMLTGHFPRATVMDVHRVVPIRRPSEINFRIPTQLEALVMRCLETKPEKRFANGKELLGALLGLQHGLGPVATNDVTPARTTAPRPFAEDVAAAARCLLAAGKVDEAIQELERAMGRVSTAPGLLMVYGDAARQARKLDAACAVYERARGWLVQQGAGDDATRDAVEALGDVLIQLKKNDDAVNEYQWLVTRWPDRKWYRYRYGVALGLAGQYRRSVEVLLKLQQDEPGLSAIYAKIAFAYLQLHKYDEAKQYFNEALMLDGHDPFSLYHLARLRALQGRLDLAENYYRRLLEVDDEEGLAEDLGKLLGRRV
jgi:tetratricopeptide (TPR) repeat protein